MVSSFCITNLQTKAMCDYQWVDIKRKSGETTGKYDDHILIYHETHGKSWEHMYIIVYNRI